MDKPIYQVMRSLTDGEMSELRQSIIDNGVLTPLAFDEEGHILDGHHRMEIIEELGIKEYPRIVHTGLTEKQKPPVKEQVMYWITIQMLFCVLTILKPGCRG